MTALRWLGRHAGAAMAAGVFVGLAVPALATAARPLLPLAVIGLLVLATARIDPGAVRVEAARPLRLLAIVAFMLIGCPLLAWLAASALGLPDVLVAALVLGASLPTLFSAPAIALVLGLDASLMLSVVVLSALASPFALALVAGPVLELPLSLSPFAIMARLAALMLGCFAAGWLARRAAGAERIARAAGTLDGIAVVLLLVFAIAIMHGVPDAFAADPARVARFTLAAFALNLGLQAAGALCTAGAGRRRALTLGFAAGNRNLGLLLAVLPASADPGIALFLALGQFPIYLLPGMLAPVYRRMLRVP